MPRVPFAAPTVNADIGVYTIRDAATWAFAEPLRVNADIVI